MCVYVCVDDCPSEIVDLMGSCWAEDPTERPNFKTIFDLFECSIMPTYHPATTTTTTATTGEPAAYMALSTKLNTDYQNARATAYALSPNL